jgi:hypothetical protein
MKNKINTDKANESLTITKPEDILAAHIAPAIKPFTAELLAAAAIDREAEAEMNESHPEAVKKEVAEIFERAAAGDKVAENKLRDAGGREAYISTRTAFFDLARAKHHAAAIATAPLWQRVSDAIIGAIDAADAAIQKQYNAITAELGEPSGLSNWNARCRNMKNGIARAPFAAETMHHGADWQIRSLGLAEIVGLDG